MMNEFPGYCLPKIHNFGWSVCVVRTPNPDSYRGPRGDLSFVVNQCFSIQLLPEWRFANERSYLEQITRPTTEFNPPLGGQGGRNTMQQFISFRQGVRNHKTLYYD